MLNFKYIDPRCTPDHLGLIPDFFLDSDPRPAVEQINDRYRHGGGWFDLKVGRGGFKLLANGALKYPEDPALPALAEAWLHALPNTVYPDGVERERIVVHAGAFVSIHQPDGSFRVSRLD